MHAAPMCPWAILCKLGEIMQRLPNWIFQFKFSHRNLQQMHWWCSSGYRIYRS